eukprot:1158999-Pelagomonas_calceolata.AAC.4
MSNNCGKFNVLFILQWHLSRTQRPVTGPGEKNAQLTKLGLEREVYRCAYTVNGVVHCHIRLQGQLLSNTETRNQDRQKNAQLKFMSIQYKCAHVQ